MCPCIRPNNASPGELIIAIVFNPFTNVSKHKRTFVHKQHITREWLYYLSTGVQSAIYILILIICDGGGRKPGLRDFYEIRTQQCDHFKRIYNASLFGHCAIIVTAIFHKRPPACVVGVHRSLK